MGHVLAHVTDVFDLNTHFRRIRFDVPDLERLGLPGHPDEAVGIYLPSADQTSVPDPEYRDGTWGYHDPDPIPTSRTYSVRAVDPQSRTMTVDFMVHAVGPATTWAQRARSGHRVVMAHAHGWYRPPPTARWRLLAADLAGLPALGRILEEDRHRSPVIAVVEVVDDNDLDYLASVRGDRPDVQIIPTTPGGNGIGPSRLAATVRAVPLPTGDGYCWFAGEAAQSRAVRKYLRHEHGWRRDHYDITGYWRADSDDWSRRYAAHGEELFVIYQRAIADGKGEKAAAEEFDEELERRGL